MKQALRALQRWLMYRPRAVALGSGSFVRRPWTITNGHLISLGRRSRIGLDAILNPLTRAESGFEADGHIEIGDDVYIGLHAQIHASRCVRICDGAVLSDYVYLNDSAHGFDPQAGLIMAQKIESRGKIVIGRNVFLGLRTTVFSGVELGDYCVVGANSVVTRSFPAYSMLVGAPARLIKFYDVGLGRWVAAETATEENL